MDQTPFDNKGENKSNRRSSGSGSKSINSPSKPKSASSRPPSALLAQAKLNAKKMKSASSTTRIRDYLEPARESKNMIRKGTGVVYDMRMVEHKSPWDPLHPEKPERFTSIINRCSELGLLSRCISIPPRYATIDEISPLHTETHVKKLEKICSESNSEEKREEIASTFDSIYFNSSTYELALLATGSTIDLITSIVEGKIQNGMAIVRPPGHHAMKDEYCGYCYFNNVALAAHKVLSDERSNVKKILIVDFDVHHGQATQQMFYNDPRVLYFSTHRFEYGTFWPNLEESNFNWIGAKDGLGFNVNVPLNTTGLGNSDFLTIWHKILIPLAYNFNPDLVIVSAGYDAALGCPEGLMSVSPQCYPHLLSPLMGLAGGKIGIVLEGGYCLKSLAESAALSLRTLLGDPCPIIPQIYSPHPLVSETILSLSSILHPFWELGLYSFLPHDLLTSIDPKSKFIPSYKFTYNEPKLTKFPTRDCHPIVEKTKIEADDKELDRLILNANLSVQEHRVGVVYDEEMGRHRITKGSHPECPERLSSIVSCLSDFGLLDRCYKIESRRASEEELSLIHSPDHIRKMKNTKNRPEKELEAMESVYNSIYFNKDSYEAALLAAGSLLNVVDSVCENKCRSGVAVVRPPGHHAEPEEACGFCLFNNVALGAAYALQKYDLKRILIIDWDVHHGNGIQNMFESSSSVLYISLHRHDHGTFFPAGPLGHINSTGSGRGKGYNVNIGWDGGRMGDREYLAAFMNVVLPIAYAYEPEIVFVSAGFDAAVHDPLGGCCVTPEGFAHLTHLLTPLANGRLILALEGGYNLSSISLSMALCTKALLGDPLPPLLLPPTINTSAMSTLLKVMAIQAEFWPPLAPFVKVLAEESGIEIGRYGKSGEIGREVGEEGGEGRKEDGGRREESGELGREKESLVGEREEDGVRREECGEKRRDVGERGGEGREDSGRMEESGEMGRENRESVEAVGEMLGGMRIGGEKEGSVPDPPISSGEPSLSLPTPPGDPMRWRGRELQENVVLEGGGEVRAININNLRRGQPERREVDENDELMGAVGGGGPSNMFEIQIGGDEASSGMYAVYPLSWCPHLETVNPVPGVRVQIDAPCSDCHSTAENWICLTCYTVKCSRYVNGHMLGHAAESGHQLVLSFSDLSVWCFGCEDYVENEALTEVKAAAYFSKFGEAMPAPTFSRGQ